MLVTSVEEINKKDLEKHALLLGDRMKISFSVCEKFMWNRGFLVVLPENALQYIFLQHDESESNIRISHVN